MTIHVTGDLFEVANALHAGDQEVAIAHGTNLRGPSGGLAAAVWSRFPDAHRRYLDAIRPVREMEDPPGLGKIHRTYNVPDLKTGRPFTIVNCFTQAEPGPSASYLALGACMHRLHRYVDGVIVLPLIGGGIGGLNPDVAKSVIMDMSDRFVLVTP